MTTDAGQVLYWEYVVCYECNGKGDDPVTGMSCPICGGDGERKIPVCEDDDEEHYTATEPTRI